MKHKGDEVGQGNRGEVMQGLVQRTRKSVLGSVGSGIIDLSTGGRIRVVTQSQDLKLMLPPFPSNSFLFIHLHPYLCREVPGPRGLRAGPGMQSLQAAFPTPCPQAEL